MRADLPHSPLDAEPPAEAQPRVKDGATGILLLTCGDRPGLVAAVSGFLAEHGGNIVHADQHTDLRAGLFLQRVEFELAGFDLPRQRIAPAFEPLARRFDMRWELRFSDAANRIAILVSRLGHCLYDLLARWKLAELPAEVAVVLSNHADLAPVARDFGVPFHHLEIGDAGRAAQERALQEQVDRHGASLVVLARYMQVLSAGFVGRYPGRILNIHHSFLPAFAGARPYHQAHARGVKVIGATAHYVTERLDEGPIIEQDVVRVSHRHSVEDLVRMGRDLERVVLARAIRRHLESRIIVYGNKTVVFD
jgi:formyltetrahydrofolate deformylase